MLNSNNIGVSGRYKITKSINGKVISQTDWIKNLVVSSDTFGLNLITRALTGNNTYPLEITQLKIGVGTNAPTSLDNDLQTPEVAGILKSNQSFANNVAELEFFISSEDLPNDDYTELGIFAGDQLFARSLIDPVYTKSDNEDTSILYQITFNAI